MESSFKMKNINFLVVFIGIITTLSYGNMDMESKLWQAAKIDSPCESITFRGMNVDLYNEQGQTPIMLAAEMNNSRFIDCLIESVVDVTITDNDGKTAFDYVRNPQSKPNEEYSVRTYKALRRLEAHQIIGDNVRIVKEEFNHKKHIYTMWIEGALCQEFPIPSGIKCFEKQKVYRTDSASMIFEKDVNRGVPPIFAAIQNRLYTRVSEILDDGVDVNKKYKNVTPLMFGIYRKDDMLVEILLKYGANPNFLEKHGLYSPLSEACVTNRILTVKLLLKYGADVNYQYKKSETALTVASKECKNFELVKLLLDYGADPKLMDRFETNTLTGLRRYCRDIVAHRKMKKFIEWNSL